MGTTPNTLNYLIAGYSAFSTILLIYLASLFIRWRNLIRDWQTLSEIHKKR